MVSSQTNKTQAWVNHCATMRLGPLQCHNLGWYRPNILNGSFRRDPGNGGNQNDTCKQTSFNIKKKKERQTLNTEDVRKSLGLSFKPPKGFVLVQWSNPPHPTTRTWGEKLAGAFYSKPTRQSPCSWVWITPQTRQWLSRHNTKAQKHLSVFRRGRTLRRSLARRRGRWISMPPTSRSLGCRTHTSPHPPPPGTRCSDRLPTTASSSATVSRTSSSSSGNCSARVNSTYRGNTRKAAPTPLNSDWRIVLRINPPSRG